MFNPYALLGACLLAVSLAGGGFAFGVRYQRGQQARTEQLIAQVKEEAQRGAAEAIAKIKIVNTTIKQQLETQIREKEVYRNCRADDITVGLLNDALAGKKRQPTGGGELSGADAPDR